MIDFILKVNNYRSLLMQVELLHEGRQTNFLSWHFEATEIYCQSENKALYNTIQYNTYSTKQKNN